MARTLNVLVWGAIFLLIAVVLVFAGIRFGTDGPLIVTGTPAEGDTFEFRYVAYPWLAYLHLVPGVLYLVGAPLQLWRRFRERHFRFHRRLGRVLLTLGLVSGVFALAFGVPFSYGGAWQSLAAAVFGSWFLVSLLLAYRAIRSGNVRMHRRWMIRAFAVGLGVGTIRIWVGLLAGTQLLPLEESFAPAFWLGLSMHVIAAELWLRWRPNADGRPRGVQKRVAAETSA
ncbi:DUF2306 domain-containing protein [Agromyces sp. NPDC049794]|uniref:DUF2306 domain-containing protein n=1 Tax=unclassified Agromyces TaxID=2639701 RepID=UPI0033F6CCAE